MRHGNAESFCIADIDRKLTNQGINNVKTTAEYFMNNYNIEYILCSSSVRTKQTADILINHSGKIIPIKFDDQLYYCDDKYIMELICNFSNEYNNLLIIGHNPVLFNFALLCNNIIVPNKLDNMIKKGLLPAGALVIEWEHNEIGMTNILQDAQIVDIFIPEVI